jgi:hypothetical protein
MGCASPGTSLSKGNTDPCFVKGTNEQGLGKEKTMDDKSSVITTQP